MFDVFEAAFARKNSKYDDTEIRNALEDKQNSSDSSLETNNKTIVGSINEVNNIAKGTTQSTSYADYESMINALNTFDNTQLRKFQNIYIETRGVPDLWISNIADTKVTYTWTNDTAFVNGLSTNGYVQVGFYKLCMLESEKVDISNKVDKITGKGLSTNDYDDTEKQKVADNTTARHTHFNKSVLDDISQSDLDKLDGIEAGAQVNTVDSVNGKTGVVVLDKSDVGLGNVDNTSDLNKPISTATQSALNEKQNATVNVGLDTSANTIVGAINEVNEIAKGATQAISYLNYSSMITAINAFDEEKFNLGQNIYVETMEVPDLWISGIEQTPVPYSYTSDTDLIDDLTANGYIQVGYYKLCMLETLKVDISTKMDKNNPTGTGSFSLNRQVGSAVGTNSFAAGNNSIASGTYTFAVGDNVQAGGRSSFALGDHTYAGSPSQTVIGKYNIHDSSSKYLLIVGDGTSDNNRRNGYTLDARGNGWYRSDIACGGTDWDSPAHKLSEKQNITDSNLKTNSKNVVEAINEIQELRMWSDMQKTVRDGKAADYFATGDRFVVEKLSTATASKGDSTGITGVTIDGNTFVYKLGKTKAGTYEMTYDGKLWRNTNGKTFKLSDYGITITGTPTTDDEIIINIETDKLVFNVIGIEQDTPANSNYTHTLALQLENLLSTKMEFDASEAAWYIDGTTYPNGLNAGQYYFTYSGNKTFTTTKNVPVGGQICIDFSNNNIITYSSKGDVEPLETVPFTSGNSGISLSLPNERLYKAQHGNNDWALSNIRQWLNSDGKAGEWWTPSHDYDRPPSYINKDGFLRGLDKSFVYVLGDTQKVTNESSSGSSPSSLTSTEKVFLLSRTEAYGGNESSSPEGIPYDYYREYSDFSSADYRADSNRKKYLEAEGFVRYWLRTPMLGIVDSPCSISNVGAVLGQAGANGKYGVAPVVVIA